MFTVYLVLHTSLYLLPGVITRVFLHLSNMLLSGLLVTYDTVTSLTLCTNPVKGFHQSSYIYHNTTQTCILPYIQFT